VPDRQLWFVPVRRPGIGSVDWLCNPLPRDAVRRGRADKEFEAPDAVAGKNTIDKN